MITASALTERQGRCAHTSAVPVESLVTGEVLAALCPDCDAQLDARVLGCTHEDLIELRSLGEPRGRAICNDCGTAGWYADEEGTLP